MLVMALVPASIIAVALSAHYGWQQVSDLKRNLKDRGKAISRQLAPACEYGVFSGNREQLKTLAMAALREEDVTEVTITSISGEVLVQVNANRGKDNSGDLAEGAYYSYQSPILQSELIEPDGNDPNSVGKNVKQPEKLGSVTVKLSTEETTRRIYTVITYNVVIILFGLGCTFYVVRRMARQIAEPIKELSRAVTEIKSGKLDYRVPVGSGWELGMLEEGINSMAETLDQAKIREKAQAEDAIYLEQIRAQVTLESIGDGVIATDATGDIVYINQVAEQITGWQTSDAVGRHLTDVYLISELKINQEASYPIGLCLQGGQIVRNHENHILVSKNKRKYLIEDTASPIKDRQGNIIGAVLVFRDVTEVRHMARKMEFLAHHDPLTGLLNRNEFEARLQDILAGARNGFGDHALCYMDLDQFKIVNDTSGHIAGDELLKQLAVLLQGRVRGNDVLARLGGDEFGIIIKDCNINEAKHIAESFKQLVSDFRFTWKNRTFDIGCSIGLVPITAGSGSMTDLLSAADSACYIAKDRGRNYVHVYQEDDVDLAKRHGEMQWVQRLKEALKLGHFVLYCQKIIPIADGNKSPEIYEILLRVQDTGLTLPEIFIPAAERYYLMPDIDRWVVQESFRTIESLFSDKAGGSNGVAKFSINLSGQSICDDKFLDFVLEQFQKINIDPRRVCFEITETAAIENLTRAQTFISAVKKLGCWFALDDFGSGLSSFGYLKSLSVDYIKIDGSFVADVMKDPIDAAMVGAINEIGHIMGLATVAESVEDIDTLNMLKEIKVDYAQGRGISEVMPLAELTLLRDEGKVK
ncbi:MAG: EAL domain-containing protein [Gammaproteobacteria bacterium]|nr:EAL domain-containing protein [Gammaproteobacteria bacterium]